MAPRTRAPTVPPAPRSPRDAFVDHCLELLAPLGAVSARRMFGGHGLYVDELFVAIIAGERLYLKVDAATAPAFDAAGCAPFEYQAEGKRVALGYRAAPAEALDSPPAMAPWGRLALQAALAARATKLKPAPRPAAIGPANAAAPRAARPTRAR
jgi:DNA transformation protein